MTTHITSAPASFTTRPLVSAALSALLSLAFVGAARADTAATSAAPSAPAKQKASKSRQKKPTSQETGLALATAAIESVSDNQIEIAKRVFTGRARCEQGQSVHLEAVKDRPGMFHLTFNGSRFLMVPEETSTGAVRLLDRNAGVVWLQIPVKSMLMNQKKGQRMIDDCKAVEQDSATQTSTMNLAPSP